MIRLIISDCDGVLTDGKLYYGAEGEVLKVFNVKDGTAIKALMGEGIKFGIVSGRLPRWPPASGGRLMRPLFSDRTETQPNICTRPI